MKKSRILQLLAVSAVSASILSGCVVGLTCIDHIDRDQNGKCDNCGKRMVVSNIEKLTWVSTPIKEYYAFNEDVDLTGGILHVVFKDGTPEKDITLPSDDENVTVTLPDMSKKGKKLVEISYYDASVTYTIEVGVVKHNVNFNLGYEGIMPAQSVAYGESAVEPEDPVREGFDFVDWYKDEAHTQKYNFSAEQVTEDITLYALWANSHKVTYVGYNSDGTDLVSKTVKGKIGEVTPEAREGFAFGGLYLDVNYENQVDYTVTVTKDTNVYVRWINLAQTTTYTVTYVLNYKGAPEDVEVQVAEGEKAPAQNSYTANVAVTERGHKADLKFDAWYLKDSEGNLTKYDMNTPVNSDLTLYAEWFGEYTFEAEHVNLIDYASGSPLTGAGGSGSATGPDMVGAPSDLQIGANASNGYYVTYLFSFGVTVTFEIYSDRDVSNAKLDLRASVETQGIALTPSVVGNTGTEPTSGLEWANYDISVNYAAIEYDPIIMTYSAADYTATGGMRPFENYTISTNVNLNKGRNLIQFTTFNMVPCGGTRTSTAPVIDCIYITADAYLTWNPVFNEIKEN